MATKVDELEARAAASVELEDLSKDSSLDAQFKALESSGASADLMLEELKAKMLTSDAGTTKPNS
jgi:phage shock protein A